MSPSLEAAVAADPFVVLTFSSPWCGPCRALEQALGAELADEPDVSAIHVDIARDPAIAQAWRVTATPTVVGLAHGKPVARSVGYSGRASLRRFLRGLREHGAV